MDELRHYGEIIKKRTKVQGRNTAANTAAAADISDMDIEGWLKNFKTEGLLTP